MHTWRIVQFGVLGELSVNWKHGTVKRRRGDKSKNKLLLLFTQIPNVSERYYCEDGLRRRTLFCHKQRKPANLSVSKVEDVEAVGVAGDARGEFGRNEEEEEEGGGGASRYEFERTRKRRTESIPTEDF